MIGDGPHRLRLANDRERLAGEIIRDYTANQLAPRLAERREAFVEALNEAGIQLGDTITVDVETLLKIVCALNWDDRT